MENKTMNAQATPEGYMQDAQGRLVPRELVSEIDALRDTFVRDIVAQAHGLQDAMVTFKTAVMGDIAAFMELSAEKYGVTIGGEKGNVTLMSFDGKYKVQRTIAESLVFDERLQIAKALVDQCINRWAIGSNSHIRAIVQHAFQTDKPGKINTGRVISLTKLQIDDAEWKQAMQAIIDSIQVAGSKSYVRVFERVGSSEQYRNIVLDIAAL